MSLVSVCFVTGFAVCDSADWHPGFAGRSGQQWRGRARLGGVWFLWLAQVPAGFCSASGRVGPDRGKGPSAQGFSGPDSARCCSWMSFSLTLLCGWVTQQQLLSDRGQEEGSHFLERIGAVGEGEASIAHSAPSSVV